MNYKTRGFNLCFARLGGSSYNGLLCGAFALNVNDVVSNSNWDYGASLFY
nr:MAG TPA: hypothetical protein [Caudoviricetes sp.]